MLAELGCNLVEIGHSERRAMFNETDEDVAQKVKSILEHNMTPLICIGEDAQVRKNGNELDFAINQATIALSLIDASQHSQCWLAYEPVWAIGVGGTPATSDQIDYVHEALQDKFPNTPVLYGGSVNPDNASELVNTKAVAGLFIGRSALTADGFLAVLNAALATKN